MRDTRNLDDTVETVDRLQRELRKLGTPKRAEGAKRYFKTGPGEYGAGDQFIGVTVPEVRRVCRSFRELPMTELKILLRSPVHEDRLAALILMTHQYERADRKGRDALFRFYIANKKFINNWDLVDTSAPLIIGENVSHTPTDILTKLAHSRSLWDRRIAIIATFYAIRQKSMKPCLDIATILLRDPHDLIHKAVGWMLREVGKRSQEEEERFLRTHAHEMPRTMLRYAIEKFPEYKRRQYLKMTSPKNP